jgi:hypothetical protein
VGVGGGAPVGSVGDNGRTGSRVRRRRTSGIGGCLHFFYFFNRFSPPASRHLALLKLIIAMHFQRRITKPAVIIFV